MSAVPEPGFRDGTLVVLAPHMDDEILGCGLLLAGHPDKSRVHVCFVTDGSRSPEPAGGSRAVAEALVTTRRQEALEALGVLGVPPHHATFLGLEDGSLAGQAGRLEEALLAHLARLDPEYVLVPFRYDRHPDHLAVNRVVCTARSAGRIRAAVAEYFVYSRWRLLPAGDIRAYLDSGGLRRLGPGPEKDARLKRRALDCYRSQTTRYFPWQSRPILAPELLDRVCAEAESYVLFDPARPGRAALARAAPWVVIAHHLEPRLKRLKDRLAAGRAA